MEKVTTHTLYELDGKYIPVTAGTIDNQLNIDGKQKFYVTLGKMCGITSESLSIEELHLDFWRAYKNKKVAIEAANKKWDSEVHLDNVKLKQQYYIIADKVGPVAVKESLVDNNNKLVQEQTHILKQGRLGEKSAYAQDPAYALAAVGGGLKKGDYTQKKCSISEFNNQYGEKKLFPNRDKGPGRTQGRGSRGGQER